MDALETNMRLIDVHCHLESAEFTGGPAQEIDAAKRAGVVKLITAAIVPDQWERSLALARQFEEVECALGIHPWYIETSHEGRLASLAQAREWGAVAIGEIGLDRRVDSPPLEVQQRFFDSQFATAKDLDLPAVIHCRAAFNQLLQSVKRIGTCSSGGIIHNFSGSIELAREFSRYGLVFSFGGVLTYRNSRKKQALLKAVYPHAMVLETDAPDISPVESPGRPNHSENIVYNLRAAAELLGEPEEKVAEATTAVAAEVLCLKGWR